MRGKHLTTLLKLLLAAGLLAGCGPSAPEAAVVPAATAETAPTAAPAPSDTAEAAPASPTTPAGTAFAVQPAQPVVPTETAAVKASAIPEPDGIDHLLEMRSVKITLTVDREGEGLRELVAEIDADGNQRMLNTSTGAESDIPAEMYVGFDAVQHEVLVIDGQAYRKDGEESAWVPVPELNDYLERSLRGSEGPGLWLRLLEGGTRDSRVNEAGGPYSVERYTLTNQVDMKPLAGDIWINISNNALVGAKIEIPGVLYTHSDGGAHYPVMIELKVEPAEVEPVALP